MMATPAREIWWVFPQMKFVFFLLYADCSTQFEMGNVLSMLVCVCVCECEWVCAILWAGTPNILLYTLFGSRTEQRPHQQRRHRRGCLCHRSWLSISLARRGGQKIAGDATWIRAVIFMFAYSTHVVCVCVCVGGVCDIHIVCSVRLSLWKHEIDPNKCALASWLSKQSGEQVTLKAAQQESYT